MNYEEIKITIQAALQLSTIQYRNETRVAFEVWAFRTAQIQNALLEEITRSEAIWNWYQNQYRKIEQRFYKENRDFLTGGFNPMEVFQVFRWMTKEIEDYYPATLINKLNNGQTVSK
ncbi:hypothetical protein [Faecalibacter macacae]|uniref:Uncharacterized protein n=1 Tax=Faecalibacter macacae TaxID=1859289 RepID=A0A3L9MDE1_9FLAO|nr:hypothetical protein [Faecalibacter macacae]RLZ08569.1 hypothetical protein EAH69_09650 [Faecalibacter macacae]